MSPLIDLATRPHDHVIFTSVYI